VAIVSKPRIVQVITRFIVGGAQLHVLELCRGLRDDFDIRVLCGPDAGTEGSLLEEVTELAPVTVVPSLHREIRPAADLATVFRLRRVLAESGADIVHTHSSKAGILGRIAVTGDTRVVHTVHGWGHTPDQPPVVRKTFIALERIAARRTDTLVAVSADVRDDGLASKIGRPETYRVIPGVVDFAPQAGDFASARRNARERLGIGDEEEVVGWVGRFVAQKDPRTLVAAIGGLLSRRAGVRVVLVGDGPLRVAVEQGIAHTGFAKRVIFTGVRDDARELYPGFDVVLHVSRWEGQPRVVQEAIAERVPVVASRASGIGDFVLSGVTGHVADVGDAAGLVTALSTVLDDPGLRAPLTDSAVAEVARRKGREIALAGHTQLYRELLADRRPSRARRA
jgi:glycosyltransferase involved in cell wall biosynthesis